MSICVRGGKGAGEGCGARVKCTRTRCLEERYRPCLISAAPVSAREVHATGSVSDTENNVFSVKFPCLQLKCWRTRGSL